MGAAIILICTDEETEAQMLKDLTKDTDEKWWVMDEKLAVELWALSSDHILTSTLNHQGTLP